MVNFTSLLSVFEKLNTYKNKVILASVLVIGLVFWIKYKKNKKEKEEKNELIVEIEEPVKKQVKQRKLKKSNIIDPIKIEPAKKPVEIVEEEEEEEEVDDEEEDDELCA
jgi:flagellar biosynthesis component FlhA